MAYSYPGSYPAQTSTYGGPGPGGSLGGVTATQQPPVDTGVFRPDAGQNMTSDQYRQWLQRQLLSDSDPSTLAARMAEYQKRLAAADQADAVAGATPQAAPPANQGPTGLYALPGYDDYAQYLKNRLTDLGTRQDSSFREGQTALANQLNRYATGQESVSALQLKAAQDQAARQQMAMAAGARPGMGAMAQRIAAQNVGQGYAGLAGQQAVAGIQERQAAANALAGLYGQGRGQDLQFQAQQDAAINNSLAALLQGSAAQQRGGISQADAATRYAIAQLQRPDAALSALNAAASGLSWLAPLLKNKGSGQAQPYQSAQDAAMDAMSGAGGAPDNSSTPGSSTTSPYDYGGYTGY